MRSEGENVVISETENRILRVSKMMLLMSVEGIGLLYLDMLDLKEPENAEE